MSKLSVKLISMKTHQPAATRLKRGTNWCILHANYIPRGAAAVARHCAQKS